MTEHQIATSRPSKGQEQLPALTRGPGNLAPLPAVPPGFTDPAPDHTRIALELDPLAQRITGVAIHGDTPFDAAYMTEVGHNLWQGGCADGLVLPSFIAHVLSLYPWERYEVDHRLASFREVRMFDDASQNLDNVVPELAAWVNSCRATGPTLVHCQAGLNRSGVVVAFALMLDGMSADEAITQIRERRSPAVLCNPEFERWLRSAGAQLAAATRPRSPSTQTKPAQPD